MKLKIYFHCKMVARVSSLQSINGFSFYFLCEFLILTHRCVRIKIISLIKNLPKTGRVRENTPIYLVPKTKSTKYTDKVDKKNTKNFCSWTKFLNCLFVMCVQVWSYVTIRSVQSTRTNVCRKTLIRVNRVRIISLLLD